MCLIMVYQNKTIVLWTAAIFSNYAIQRLQGYRVISNMKQTICFNQTSGIKIVCDFGAGSVRIIILILLTEMIFGP